MNNAFTDCFHAFMLFIAALQYLPKFVLSAIIVVAIMQIIELQAIPRFWRVQKR